MKTSKRISVQQIRVLKTGETIWDSSVAASARAGNGARPSPMFFSSERSKAVPAGTPSGAMAHRGR